jgi:3D (Asp-Asp-Asp) domain-containing protein
MRSSSTADKSQPPKLGVWLLYTILFSETARNEVGDLEEEYRLKVREENNKTARRWFWREVLSTVYISLREFTAGRALLRKARQWCHPRVSNLLVVSDWPQISPQTSTAHVAVSVVFVCLISALLIGPGANDIGEQSSPDGTQPRSFESQAFVAEFPATEYPPAPAPTSATPPQPYTATAYSLRGRTASGRQVSRGLIAADPSVLPLGSRVRLEHPGYSGEYLVADNGGAIRGRRIDIWTPSTSEAMRFGRRSVKLTVLSYGTRRTT